MRKAVPRSAARILLFLAPAVSATEALPRELSGRWCTADGQYPDQHEVKVAAQDGTAISGTRITWSGPCQARPAKFSGSFDGDTLIIKTGDENPCAPVVLGLKKEPDKARFSGAWQVPDFNGTAYLEPLWAARLRRGKVGRLRSTTTVEGIRVA